MKRRTGEFRIYLYAVLVLPFIFLAAFVRPYPLYAQDASINDIIVTNSKSHLLLYFTVRNGFSSGMEEGIKTGMPATFTFRVKLYQVRKGWPDRELVSHAFSHVLSYDNLKEDYRVEKSERDGNVVTVETLAEAEEVMAEVNGFKVIAVDSLVPDTNYRLKVKAGLAQKNLPFYFHYIIPFWSFGKEETDWYTVEFRY